MMSETPDMLYPIAIEKKTQNANNRINTNTKTWK